MFCLKFRKNQIYKLHVSNLLKAEVVQCYAPLSKYALYWDLYNVSIKHRHYDSGISLKFWRYSFRNRVLFHKHFREKLGVTTTISNKTYYARFKTTYPTIPFFPKSISRSKSSWARTKPDRVDCAPVLLTPAKSVWFKKVVGHRPSAPGVLLDRQSTPDNFRDWLACTSH